MGVPPLRSPRYASLDLWRGFACLLVLLNHSVFYRPGIGSSATVLEGVNRAIAALATRAWAGVPIFFVISGYCITATVMRESGNRDSVGAYFFKRFRRIFPPYWTALLGGAILIGAADVALRGSITADGFGLRPWWFSASQWIGSLTLTEIWRAHLIGGPKGLILGPAWTLCYEEQFYAVCGLLLLLCPRRFFAGATAVTTAVLLSVVAAERFELKIDGFFFDGAWIQFALGILLFYAVNYGSRHAKRLTVAVFVSVVVWALSSGWALLAPDKNPAQAFLVAGVFSILALMLKPLDRKMATSRLLKPFQVCGIMCYSLYLVQAPIVSVIRGLLVWMNIGVFELSPLASLPLCFVPTLWVAWRFHSAIERRFMPAQRERMAIPEVNYAAAV